MDANFVENFKVVPIMDPSAASGGLTEEYVCLKHAKKATWIIHNTSIGTDHVYTFRVAADKAGVKKATSASSRDMTITNAWVSNAATNSSSASSLSSNADMYTKLTVTASTFTLAHGTYDQRVVIVEADASKMGTFSSSSVTYDADYIALNMTAGAEAVSCICILTGLRYQEDSPSSALL